MAYDYRDHVVRSQSVAKKLGDPPRQSAAAVHWCTVLLASCALQPLAQCA